MEITRPRTCNANYTPRDVFCTPREVCGEGPYRNLLFNCRVVLTVLKSIHPRRGKKNEFYRPRRYEPYGQILLWVDIMDSSCGNDLDTITKEPQYGDVFLTHFF